jgi:hypothetical protein
MYIRMLGHGRSGGAMCTYVQQKETDIFSLVIPVDAQVLRIGLC